MRFVFGKDGENMNLGFGDVKIDAEVIDAKPILRLAKATEALNPSFASPAWFVAKMSFDGCKNGRTSHRPKRLQILNGLWRKNNFISHSGQNMARVV